MHKKPSWSDLRLGLRRGNLAARKILVAKLRKLADQGAALETMTKKSGLSWQVVTIMLKETSTFDTTPRLVKKNQPLERNMSEN